MLLLSKAAVSFAWLGCAVALADGQPSLAPMLERVLPSVVSLAVEADEAASPSASEDGGATLSTEVTGSGVIVDAGHGLILTSNHVVADAGRIIVRLSDGSMAQADLVGTDPETDLAVIRTKPSGLKAIKLGSSTSLHVGDYVVAIGNPFGLGEAASLGIVGALGRSGFGLEGVEDYIQTDASMNPGSSGGALVNINGELVGINTAIMGPSDTNVGVGFSLPVDTAQLIMKQLISDGEVRRGQLGVTVQDNDLNFQQALAIKSATGALVGEVIAGSPAAKAGLQTTDVIVGIDDVPVHNARELRRKIASCAPGTIVTISVLRQDGKFELRATVGAETKETAVATVLTLQGEGLLSLVTLQSLDQASDAYGKVKGALVTSMSDRSKASASGLFAGDVIVSVDRRPAETPQAVVELSRRAKDLLLLGIYRDGHTRFIVVR